MAGWVDDGTSSYTVGDAAGPRLRRARAELRRAGVGSLIVLPLAAAGERYGLLVLADRASRRPAAEDVELLELLALQAATRPAHGRGGRRSCASAPRATR